MSRPVLGSGEATHNLTSGRDVLTAAMGQSGNLRQTFTASRQDSDLDPMIDPTRIAAQKATILAIHSVRGIGYDDRLKRVLTCYLTPR